MKSAICALTLLAAVLAVPQTGSGQETLPPLGSSTTQETPRTAQSVAVPSTTFRSATELVALSVTVTDVRERFVRGLSKDDFAVFEDGLRQDLTFFATNDIPLDVALMIDTSASMADKMLLVHDAATRFVQALRPGDRAEVLGFSGDTRVLAPFTDDKEKLGRAIASTTPRGGTALYNSLYIAIQELTRLSRNDGNVRRPAIVVLTDGDDTTSMLSLEDLMDAVKHSNVAIYAISIVSKTDSKRFASDGSHRFTTEADYGLTSLCQDTGGRAYFPMELKDLSGVYTQIAEELSSQYSLGYSPKVHADGSFHRLLVRVLNRDDVRPRTRNGYYVPRVRAAVESR